MAKTCEKIERYRLNLRTKRCDHETEKTENNSAEISYDIE